ncbi:S-methyl-5-thioribose-1-phosphate isomerase [Thermithiobacillus plumbiphilus]|uniref:Methylthioribose-1-phosphate isomerase n=1 Tax=Thermithiobacillus plumbiphilus TaxID=1729899 RepID=A0ABU9D765_9PROT
MHEIDTVRAVRWQDDALHLLDQRVLPHEVSYLVLQDFRATADAIRDMVVRGAPAIGITAAYGMALAAREFGQHVDWRERVQAAADVLNAARPTAVNLAWAIARQNRILDAIENGEQSFAALLAEAQRIASEDVEANRRMGQAGARFIPADSGVLTHCNTGSLATGGYGTALGIIRAAVEQGRKVQVYADETRPWWQGARLTAWELQQDGIPVNLVVDSAAASLMAAGRIQSVVVGADRIAANGDTANKIGTYGLAVLARYHGIPFIVAAPTSTIDFATPTGADIHIEERPAEEITQVRGVQLAPLGTQAVNPAFDVTPAELITAIVTERGVVESPTAARMQQLIET